MNLTFDFFRRFMTLSDEVCKLLKGATEVIIVPKGKMLVWSGMVNPYAFVIYEGVVRGFQSNDNEEFTISLWQEGNFFCDITTYITEAPALKSYQVIEDARLLRIDIKMFKALFTVSPEINNLGRLLIEDYIIRHVAAQNLYRGKDASEKFEKFLTEKPGLIHRVKHKQIASYLGLTPETFCRINANQLKNNHKIIVKPVNVGK